MIRVKLKYSVELCLDLCDTHAETDDVLNIIIVYSLEFPEPLYAGGVVYDLYHTRIKAFFSD